MVVDACILLHRCLSVCLHSVNLLGGLESLLSFFEVDDFPDSLQVLVMLSAIYLAYHLRRNSHRA